MNVKKLISSVSALAIAASAFAGLAVTASADAATLTADFEVAGYLNAAYYDFIGDSKGLLPAQAANTLSNRDDYGLFNWGSGNRSATVTLPEELAVGEILVVDGRATQSYGYSVSINCGTKNEALSTSTGYEVFDITTATSDVTFSVGRANTIRAISVYDKDESAATAGYTVKYVDENGDSIKDDLTGTGVVGGVVTVEKTDYYNDGGQKYIYVSDDSAANTIESDGTTVVTVTYRTAAEYSYSVVANVGDVVIAEGTAYEGDQITAAYPRYVNVEGTLYSRGATDKTYSHKFILDEDNKVVTLDYTATDISNVVFLAEGEDIESLTASNANNTKARSSKAGSAYAAADAVITSLPAGKYQVYGVLFSASSGGANLEFTLGDNNFAFVSTSNSNWVDVNSDELEITEETDLVLAAGGGNNAALDYIYIVKTGEVAPPAPTTYTIALDYADGTEPVTTEKEENDTFIFPTPEEPEGFAFLGWKLNKLGGDDVIVQGGDSITVTADASYTAVWIKYPTLDEDMIGIFTQYDGNPAVAYKGTATAGTYAIDSLKWYVMEDVNQIGSVDIDVNIAADTSVVVGLVVEAATVEADNIWAYLGIGGYAELD